MLNVLRTRLKLGSATLPSPEQARLPLSFRGRPELDPGRCQDGCTDCETVCPTGAVTSQPLGLDLGACLLCGACAEACPAGAVTLTNDHRMATRSRAALRLAEGEIELATALDATTRRVFGRALRLRQVSAGGCNGCEAELSALGNVVFDLARYGVEFVASPRHADGVVVTGPVTVNMRQALLDTWEATPSPRILIAVGACAISGGPVAGAPYVLNGLAGGLCGDLSVDLYVPGCPPHPLTVLDGILRLLGEIG